MKQKFIITWSFSLADEIQICQAELSSLSEVIGAVKQIRDDKSCLINVSALELV